MEIRKYAESASTHGRQSIDFEAFARDWNQTADGKDRFYVTAEVLSSYLKAWEKSSNIHATEGVMSAQLDKLHSSAHIFAASDQPFPAFLTSKPHQLQPSRGVVNLQDNGLGDISQIHIPESLALPDLGRSSHSTYALQANTESDTDCQSFTELAYGYPSLPSMHESLPRTHYKSAPPPSRPPNILLLEASPPTLARSSSDPGIPTIEPTSNVLQVMHSKYMDLWQPSLPNRHLHYTTIHIISSFPGPPDSFEPKKRCRTVPEGSCK